MQPATQTAPLQDRLHAAQVETLYRNVTVGVLVAGSAAVVQAACLVALGGASALAGAAWAAFVCACATLHIGLRWLRQRSAAADRGRSAPWRRWGNAFAVVALAEGIAWGWAAIGLVGPEHYDFQLIALLVTYAIAGGAISVFGSHLPSLWCIFVPTTVPVAVANLLHGGGEHLTAGLLCTMYVFGMGAVCKRSNDEFNHGLRLRLEVDDLAHKLRLQKELAEEANLAKSRFLAAASHDLRQPVHALSLSVGALQAMALAPDARTLVGHIEQSVDALDGLFSALLDISKLDAAVVTPQPRAFAVQPVIDRVCRDHAAEAAAKGVDLRTAPCSLAIHTDPVLFERVLRNLVANAVRYTDRGRVLVGCRRGRTVRLEVWDTGRGIPAALHERVFEEFFQVGNTQRDRSVGLGLGLAIVRRLTSLLGIALTLRSREGAGSVFTLTLARAEPVHLPLSQALPPAPSLAAPSALPSSRKLVLVVDDEAAIRTAMRALLTGWGFQVVDAGSCGEMLASLESCPVLPDLLICDVRLRDGEDGIATVRRLQSEYNDDLPAILITGDTGPDRLLDAQASGLPMLHKPVEHTRLRRAIEHQLAGAAAGLSVLSPGAPLPPASG